MYRTIAARCSTRSLAIQSRTLHSSPIAFNKTVTEKVKDAADTVNKKVGQGLASAIESGEQATQKAKEAVGVGAKEASEKTKEGAELAKQKGNQAAAGAKEAKDDFKKEMKK